MRFSRCFRPVAKWPNRGSVVELCEAVTDPIPGQGWYDDVHGEIGDICAWKTKKLGAYTVQLEWSNNAAACI